MDELCRSHDIAYENNASLTDRHKADEILQEQAWKLTKSKDTGLGEKLASYAVTNAMKTKRKLGAGCGYGRCSFRKVLSVAKKAMKTGEKDPLKLVKRVVGAVRKTFKKKQVNKPRVIPIPKSGGVIPLIPIFAGLSALGALSGGIANVIKVVNELKSAKNPTTLGKGLYLKPYKNGQGLYLEPFKRGSGFTAGKKKNFRKERYLTTKL